MFANCLHPARLFNTYLSKKQITILEHLSNCEISVAKVQQLPSEKLVLKLKPHPLAFWHLYAVSGVLILLAYEVRQFYAYLARFTLELPIPFLQQHNSANILVLWTLLVGVAIIIGFVYVRATSLLVFSAIAFTGTVLTEYVKMPLDVHYWLLIVCGLVGFVLTEFHRRGHSYYVTNKRIVMEKSFLSYDSRQFAYDRIEDLAVVQGVLGRVLNYGTVIPVTGSGFGLGEDSASLGIGGAVGIGGKRILPVGGGISLSASGGRAVLMPRGRTYHTLYGIPRPKEVQQAIVMIMMQGHVPEKTTVGPYL